MPWGRVDDRLHRHRKVRKSGLEAMGLWVLAHSLCSDQVSEGVVTADDCAALVAFAEGSRRPRARHDQIAATLSNVLVEAGFWEVVTDGAEQRSFRFHDWREYLPSADKVAEAKAKGARAAAARWGAKDAREHAPSIPAPDASGMLRARDPVPSRPVPSRPDDLSEGQASLPLGPPAPVEEHPKKLKTKTAKPTKTADPAIADAWSRWTSAFESAQGRKYIRHDADGAKMIALIAQARAALEGDGLELGDVLGHWFDSYLADSKRFVVDSGYGLRFLAGEVNRYGLPDAERLAWRRRGPPEPSYELVDIPKEIQ